MEIGTELEKIAMKVDPTGRIAGSARHFDQGLIAVAACAVALFVVTHDCRAQDEGDAGVPAPNGGTNNGAIHLDLGVDWTSQYFFRGLIQEDNGFIIQPWAEVGVDLWEGEDASLGAIFGIWNSVHGETDTAGSSDNSVENWYESDLYLGLNLEVGEWSFNGSYIWYLSPSDAFTTGEEVILSVGYDDSSLWGGKFALNPHILLALETGEGTATGNEKGSYLELGVAPGFDWEPKAGTLIEFEIPLTVGFSIEDYYQSADDDDDTFGFFSAGLNATLSLPVPPQYGAWSLSGGVHVLALGEAAEQLNSDEDLEVIGTIGLSISY